jgi:hypothetical protein
VIGDGKQPENRYEGFAGEVLGRGWQSDGRLNRLPSPPTGRLSTQIAHIGYDEGNNGARRPFDDGFDARDQFRK